MSDRPLLLDLFCGAGGCAVGYHRAGFDVLGVDNRPQPRYPFPFVQADALEYVAEHGHEYDVIHASPPCQRYTRASFREACRRQHPDLVGPVRQVLAEVAGVWILENVAGSPLSAYSAVLCGLMFGLKVFRHRLFESSHLLFAPEHPSHKGKRIGEGGMCCVIGHGGGASMRMRMRSFPGCDNKAAWSAAMGIDWMSRDEMAQAIPPAYTEFLGKQLLSIVESQRSKST